MNNSPEYLRKAYLRIYMNTINQMAFEDLEFRCYQLQWTVTDFIQLILIMIPFSDLETHRARFWCEIKGSKAYCHIRLFAAYKRCFGLLAKLRLSELRFVCLTGQITKSIYQCSVSDNTLFVSRLIANEGDCKQYLLLSVCCFGTIIEFNLISFTLCLIVGELGSRVGQIHDFCTITAIQLRENKLFCLKCTFSFRSRFIFVIGEQFLSGALFRY